MRDLRFIWWQNKRKIGAVIVQAVTVPILAILMPFALVWYGAYKIYLQARKGQSSSL